MLKWCVMIGLDWSEPMCLVLFYLSLSLFLSVCCFMAPKWKSTSSQNPLHCGASTSDSTPSHIRFRDEKARTDFSENFSRKAFIQNAKSSYRTFPILTFPLSSRVRGWESLCGISITCPSVIIHYFYSNMHGFDYSIPHFFTHIRGTYIVVTLDLLSEVLHVSRVMHPDYLGCNHLKTVSKDELSSLFYETPLSWGDCQNTTWSGFAKGLRFLSMVMTFVLYLLSHYNSITEPRAWFLLSLIKRITIYFLSHFILSLINVYRDTATHDKLIFPSAITWIIRHFFVSYLESDHFPIMCADNTLILHIYIIIRKHYHAYFELIHVFYNWFWNNAK